MKPFSFYPIYAIVGFLSISQFLFSQSKFYIDPYANPGGDGTIEFPFDSLSDLRQINGASYFLKRGTSIRENIQLDSNNMTLDAYGQGANPKIHIKGGKSARVVRVFGDNCAVRNIDMSTTDNTTGTVVGFSRCSGGEIRNCTVSGADLGINTYLVGGSFKILNTTVHNIGQDGMFLSNTDTVIIDSTYVYDVNLTFNIGIYGKGNGDGIQTASVNYTRITNTVVDRQGTNNKFAIILQASKEVYMDNCILYGSDLIYDEFSKEHDLGMHTLYLSGVSGPTQIKNCKIYSGNNGLWNQYSQNIVVDSCEFYNQESIAIRGAQNNMTITNSLFYNPGYQALGGGWSGPVSLFYNNNYFYKGNSITASGDAVSARDNLYFPWWHKLHLYDDNPIEGFLGEDYEIMFHSSTQEFEVINRRSKAQNYLYLDYPEYFECYYFNSKEDEEIKFFYDVNKKSFVVVPLNNTSYNFSLKTISDSVWFSEDNLSGITVVSTRTWTDSICLVSLNKSNVALFNETVYRVDSMFYPASFLEEETLIQNKFKVYYTPTNQMLNIQVLDYDNIPFVIDIYSVQGHLLKTYKLTDEYSMIDVSGLIKGVYIVDLMHNVGLDREGHKFVRY